MYAVERVHRAREDRDWLPARVRRAGWWARVGLWTASAVAVGSTIALAPWSIGLVKLYALALAGGLVAGEGIGRRVGHQQLVRLTGGEIPLADVTRLGEGELVVVEGVIEADSLLRGTLVDVEGVYRRLDVAADEKWVHEAAVDFAVRDDAGVRVRVQAGGARWMVPPRETYTYPSSRLLASDLPATLRDALAGRTEVEAVERVLTVGTRVQIVGYKTRTPDPSGDVGGDYRSPPSRASLRSGPGLPLVIVSAEDVARMRG